MMARARREGGRDGVYVEVEGSRIDLRAHRDAARTDDKGLVEEPGWGDEHHLVAGVHHCAQRDGESAGGPIGEEDIIWVEGHAAPLAQDSRHGSLRLGIVIRVSKPSLVLGHTPMAERVHESGQRHLVGVPNQEVGHSRLMLAACLGRCPEKLKDRRSRADRCNAARDNLCCHGESLLVARWGE